MGTSVVVLANSYTKPLGTDDSALDQYNYRVSWALMIVCGVFCTLGSQLSSPYLLNYYMPELYSFSLLILGSMAFMRAVHDDPPMKPLFTYYHLQSDELLGSWLFLCSTVPLVPYCFLYLATAQGDWKFIGALAVSVFCVIGAGLFVYCCYPNDQVKARFIIFSSTFYQVTMSLFYHSQDGN